VTVIHWHHETQIPYSLVNHTTLLVDISEIGLGTEVYPPLGKTQPVPSIRFQTRHDAEERLARGDFRDQHAHENRALDP
jgi:hypothetical protein